MSKVSVSSALALLVLAGCQSVPAIEGAGFVDLTPSAGTRDYIIAHDRPFANQVEGNNRACRRTAACAKAE